MDLILGLLLVFFAGWLLGRVQATKRHAERLAAFFDKYEITERQTE